MADTGLFNEFKQRISTAELPALGPGPRAGVLAVAGINRVVDAFVEKSRLPAPKTDLLRALALLWHDHLDESHVISQNISSADGSFVHGIMHRREPDYGNAKYWFRRVENHPGFPELSRRAAGLPGRPGTVTEFIRDGAWDAFAFVDACERVAGKPASDPGQQFLREVQRVEFEVLLERFTT